MKELYRHLFACPAVFHQGMWTIDAGSIAVGRYFNLNPVQSWAPDFVQLPFKPFKHSSCHMAGNKKLTDQSFVF